MFVGIDHSTTGVKTSVLRHDGTTDAFTIERVPDDDGNWSFLDRLSEYVDLDEIDLVANGYSYGDAFSEITAIQELDERGVVDHLGAGHGFGTGTQVFDELRESDIPTVMFPGIHDGIDSVHQYFRYYSVCSGADTVAMARYAKEIVSEEYGDACTFIAPCVSSSAMAVLVHEGEIRGGFHWLGLIHGHIDIEMLRRVRDGEQGLDDIVMRSGLIFRAGKSFSQIKGVPDEELLRGLYWSTIHNVYSLLPFANHLSDATLDQIVMSGRLSRVEEPIDMRAEFREVLEQFAPVHFCEEYSTSLGAAHIAKDVYEGAPTVLGIPVGSVPNKAVNSTAR